MSVIMDAAIICLYEDDLAIEQVNKKLYELDEARHQQFHKIDNSSAGGSKYPSMTVYQACFNHLLEDDVITAFKSANFQHRHPVLILDHEFSELPKITFKDGGKGWGIDIYE